MKCVFEAVVRLISRSYEQLLQWVGHGSSDVDRSWSEPRFPFKKRLVVENPTWNAFSSVSFGTTQAGRSVLPAIFKSQCGLTLQKYSIVFLMKLGTRL
jgi:hypothetical protein